MRVSVTVRGLLDAIRALRGYSAARRARLTAELDRIGARAVTEIRTRYRRGGTTATRTAVRTGRLMGSYGHIARGTTLAIGVEAGSRALVYASVHEGLDRRGAQRDETRIRPRRGRWLTVPLPAALTPAGVLRAPARAWSPTFVRRGIIYWRDERRRRVVPIFLLKREVVVPARPALARIAPRVMRDVEEAVRRVYAGE